MEPEITKTRGARGPSLRGIQLPVSTLVLSSAFRAIDLDTRFLLQTALLLGFRQFGDKAFRNPSAHIRDPMHTAARAARANNAKMSL